jgi:Tol biopolymer transport system component
MPNGAAIAYGRSAPGGGQIVRRALASGEEQVLFSYGQNGAADWSFDVNRDEAVAVVARRDSASVIVVRSADGSERELWRAPAGEQVAWVTWTADGRDLLFVRSRAVDANGPPAPLPGIWSVNGSGGEPRFLGIQMPGLRALVVSPDGRSVAFTAGEMTREPYVVEHVLPPAGTRARARRQEAHR